MNTELKYEFKVDLTPVRRKSHRYRMANISNEPKLRQYLVLAYQIQETLEHDSTIMATKVAEWLNMTPPRICQILNLLLLCPTIQCDILLSQNKKLCDLGEYNVRKITKEPLWEKQIETWNALLV